ncbi:MAG: serine protease [Rickettsiales bacterium]|nr:serine protease [Rickettsiales bacterium]
MLTIALILGLSSSAWSLSYGTRIEYAAGTGFFVSPYGHVITNYHVIRDCSEGQMELRGAVNGIASVVGYDRTHDLALLQADLNSPSVGRLLATERSINVGDKVLVMGYPLSHAESGEYKIATSQVVGITGPTGEPQWLQFSDAAQKGNSGGPLLDTAGNIIGVVTGKTELYSIDQHTMQRTSLGRSDIAVSLPILKQFLKKHRINYMQAESMAVRSDRMIETVAQRFILNIRCVTQRQNITLN